MIDGPPIMIIGIGNLDRGDDAAGRLVARALRYKLPSHIVGVCEMSGEALGLVEKMKRAPTVFVIDACLSGKKAGEIRRIDLRHEALPSQQRDVSSHGFGLLAAANRPKPWEDTSLCWLGRASWRRSIRLISPAFFPDKQASMTKTVGARFIFSTSPNASPDISQTPTICEGSL